AWRGADGDGHQEVFEAVCQTYTYISMCRPLSLESGQERTGAGVFTDRASNAGTGRAKPFRVSSPTEVVSASWSTAAWTRWLRRICPALASADNLWARMTTLPIAP